MEWVSNDASEPGGEATGHLEIGHIQHLGVWGLQWFMLPWVARMQDTLTVKKLAPIVIAAAIWGQGWHGKVVLAQCDNSAVVAIVNSGASKNVDAMQLTRCLAFLEAKKEFSIWATRIQESRNQVADALSRNKLQAFRIWCPQAQEQESHVPPELLDSLLLLDPDWTCRSGGLPPWPGTSGINTEDLLLSQDTLCKCVCHDNRICADMWPSWLPRVSRPAPPYIATCPQSATFTLKRAGATLHYRACPSSSW